jgi:uncharacterized protein (TIGR02145 family)
MAGNITPKKGGLSLSAEKDGEPASEPVFVNGRRVGETPFSGTVPVCAKVEIGDGREAVDVELRYNEKVKHTHSLYGGKPFTDSRNGKKYRTVAIGEQTWMAENLNYNASGSKCYDNKPANCDKYGRLYNWSTARNACPKGWHLPSYEEWEALMDFVGGSSTAGTKLKSASGWSTGSGYKPGTDEFGFSALPGGFDGGSSGFGTVGISGGWWNAKETNASYAYSRAMYYYRADVVGYFYGKTSFFSVRCVKD